ncbi:MAG TPA: ABC transporter permease [Longimicrobiaceae bacterium]|nr:ABC transporter permease [Longimicrobiaceae bacterium]
MEATTGDAANGEAQPQGPFMRWAARVGRSADGVAHHAYGLGMIVWRTLYYLFTGRISLRDVINQIYWVGVQSVPIVLVTSTLSGVVTSQQGGYQFSGSVPLYVLGSVVSQSVILELGPVLTAVVLIGRVGARITAELGTMQVSEQIDALHSLGRDPIRTLVAPRIIAGIISVPLLVGIADCIGMLSGMLSAQLTVGLGYRSFLYGAGLFWHSWDMLYSLSKATVFGFVIPLLAAHMGLNTRGGAEGVGRSTTSAVVAMTLAVLILDAMFPPLMLQ